ncbi:MAG TPA: PilZ domain-containing protein [Myxococcaceae bacterium]|nr:PilZ domain-containing protein [Myxococcaceae bacterium]
MAGSPANLSSLFEGMDQNEKKPQTAPEQAQEALVGRAPVALEVAFETPQDAVRAYTQNVGVGQIAIATKDTFPKGMQLTVKLRVPGWQFPLVTVGKVTWSREGAMGIAFTALKPDEQEKLTKLVLDHTSKLDRVKRQFTRLMEQPVAAKVTGRCTALVQLADEMMNDTVAELLNEGHVVATSDPASGSNPNLIVADMATAVAVAEKHPKVPLVMVNASGPNELALNRMPFLPAKAFVPRPATPQRIAQTVQQLVRAR